MTEQSWAEGSGSTWESPDGDPRIQPGAEVLLGQRTDDGLYVPSMRKFVGRRARVTHVDGRGSLPFCKTDCDRVGWNWRVRDLVCLRTADGQLTEEGRWLDQHRNVRLEGGTLVNVYPLDAPTPEAWAVRAGILVPGPNDWYVFDRRRLAMALGEEPPAVKSEPAKATEPAPVGAGVCADCGRPLDALSPVDRPPGAVESRCGDCGFKEAKASDQQVAALRRVCEHAGEIWERAADHSGERHLDALRDWLSGPCGRQSWTAPSRRSR